MQSRKIYMWAIAALLTLVLGVDRASSQTLNTFSTYSMYGLGDLQTMGTLKTRSMGGAGVAMRDIGSINLLNPASYSIALRKGMLFDMGFEGATYIASQKDSSGSVQTSGFTTANFRDLSIQFPLAKGIGFGFSVTPYSNVGYSLMQDEYTSNPGYIKYNYDGSGGISEFKFGVGWELFDGVSIGVAAQYYWGNIDREFNVTVYNMTSSSITKSLSGVDNISVSRLKGQFGIQADILRNERRSLTAGITYDVGGNLNPRSARVVEMSGNIEDIYTQNDTVQISVILPRKLTYGVQYSNRKWEVAADFDYQGWAGLNDAVEKSGSGMEIAYNDVATVRIGAQLTPRRADVRHYFNRVNYRFGASYGGYQYTLAGEKISQYTVTAGAGLPIKVIGISKINIGLEWGGLGSLGYAKVDGEQIGLVRQNCFRFSLGFTFFGDDYWFQRPQID